MFRFHFWTLQSNLVLHLHMHLQTRRERWGLGSFQTMGPWVKPLQHRCQENGKASMSAKRSTFMFFKTPGLQLPRWQKMGWGGCLGGYGPGARGKPSRASLPVLHVQHHGEVLQRSRGTPSTTRHGATNERRSASCKRTRPTMLVGTCDKHKGFWPFSVD